MRLGSLGLPIILLAALLWSGTAEAQNAYITNLHDGTVSVVDTTACPVKKIDRLVAVPCLIDILQLDLDQ